MNPFFLKKDKIIRLLFDLYIFETHYWIKKSLLREMSSVPNRVIVWSKGVFQLVSRLLFISPRWLPQMYPYKRILWKHTRISCQWIKGQFGKYIVRVTLLALDFFIYIQFFSFRHSRQYGQLQTPKLDQFMRTVKKKKHLMWNKFLASRKPRKYLKFF